MKTWPGSSEELDLQLTARHLGVELRQSEGAGMSETLGSRLYNYHIIDGCMD